MSNSGAAEPTADKPLTREQAAMVEKNIPLVRHIVARVTERFPHTEERDDLLQSGLLGLVEATKRFDPDLGFSFSTFAGRRIEGAILDSLRRNDWAPRSLRRQERVLQDADATLTASLHRKPTCAELSAATGLPETTVRGVMVDLSRLRVDSLFDDSGRGDGTEGLLSDPPDHNARPLSQNLEEREMLSYLRAGIRHLPERHRAVVVGHFFEGKSMTELGELLGVTQSRASQLKSDALEMLRIGVGAAVDETPPDPRATQRQTDFNQAVADESSPYERLGIRKRLAAVS